MVTNVLKEIRMKQYMMNKKEFASMLEIAEQQYGRYENMSVVPSLEVALRVSCILDKPVNEIFKLENSSK